MELVITVNLDQIQVKGVGGIEVVSESVSMAIQMALDQLATHRVRLDYEISMEIEDD